MLPPIKLQTEPAGIGLIEIILSISILAIGVLGILQVFPRGVATEKQLEYDAIASQLAQAKMEELSALPYDSLAPGTLENQVRLAADPASMFYNFLRTTEVTLLDQNLNAGEGDIGFKKITITILWPAVFGGGQKSTNLSTLVTKR